MKPDVIQRLNEINNTFYQSAGKFWNKNQNYYWEGWDKITQYLTKYQTVSALDIGCGNGRFAYFLDERIPQFSGYVGIDYSTQLLSQLQTPPQSTFYECDILKTPISELLPDRKFNCVSLWGVIHHIPGAENRQKLISTAADMLVPGGIMFFTTWQFTKVPRLQKRIIQYNSEEGRRVYAELGVRREDLEEGDEIVGWVKKVMSYRYSHAFTDEEVFEYIDTAGLQLLDVFESDDRTQNRNKYFVLKKV